MTTAEHTLVQAFYPGEAIDAEQYEIYKHNAAGTIYPTHVRIRQVLNSHQSYYLGEDTGEEDWRRLKKIQRTNIILSSRYGPDKECIAISRRKRFKKQCNLPRLRREGARFCYHHTKHPQILQKYSRLNAVRSPVVSITGISSERSFLFGLRRIKDSVRGIEIPLTLDVKKSRVEWPVFKQSKKFLTVIRYKDVSLSFVRFPIIDLIITDILDRYDTGVPYIHVFCTNVPVSYQFAFSRFVQSAYMNDFYQIFKCQEEEITAKPLIIAPVLFFHSQFLTSIQEQTAANLNICNYLLKKAPRQNNDKVICHMRQIFFENPLQSIDLLRQTNTFYECNMYDIIAFNKTLLKFNISAVPTTGPAREIFQIALNRFRNADNAGHADADTYSENTLLDSSPLFTITISPTGSLTNFLDPVDQNEHFYNTYQQGLWSIEKIFAACHQNAYEHPEHYKLFYPQEENADEFETLEIPYQFSFYEEIYDTIRRQNPLFLFTYAFKGSDNTHYYEGSELNNIKDTIQARNILQILTLDDQRNLSGTLTRANNNEEYTKYYAYVDHADILIGTYQKWKKFFQIINEKILNVNMDQIPNFNKNIIIVADDDVRENQVETDAPPVIQDDNGVGPETLDIVSQMSPEGRALFNQIVDTISTDPESNTIDTLWNSLADDIQQVLLPRQETERTEEEEEGDDYFNSLFVERD